MILQLNPQLSVLTPLGWGLAQFLIDYGPAHNTVWVIALWDTGDIKHFDSNEVKLAGNEMYDIPEPTEFKKRNV